MAIAAAVSSLQQNVLRHPLQSLAVTALVAPIIYIIINELIRASARVPGFKGPRGLPLIGNLAQIRKNAAEQYRVWSKTYGPVYQIQLGNIPVIVVNSAAAAKILFGQNAQALSSRPEFYTFHRVRERSYPAFPNLVSPRAWSNVSNRLFRTPLERQSELLPIVSL
jgi:3-hydroxyphenylacetate 6-hydroxylase